MGRLMTAMVTPMAPDLSVDYRRAAELAKRLVAAQSDGLVVAGTTGESPTLTDEEKLRLFETVVDAVGDQVMVIAGTGSNDTHHSVELTRRAEALGVHGVMLVAPYYNRPSQEGLYRHFRAVAEATRLPVMLYNIPGRTGVNVSAATCLQLARDVPNIVAIKEASGDLDQVADVCRGRPKDFLVLSGDDKYTLPMLAVGADGVVSVASHLVGPDIAQMIAAFQAGNVRRATELHHRLLPLFRGLFFTTNPVPVKWALRYTGLDVGGVRPPLAPPAQAEEEQLRALLHSLGLI